MRVLQPDFFADFFNPDVLKKLLRPKAAVTLSILAEFTQDLSDYKAFQNTSRVQYSGMVTDCTAQLSSTTMFDELSNFINVDAFTRANIATIVYNIMQLGDQVNISSKFIQKCVQNMDFVDESRE